MTTAQKFETVDDTTIEPKVATATFGSGAAGVVSGFILYLLGTFIWHGSGDAVPLPVQQVVLLVVPAAGAFIGGWLTRHVNR